MILTNDPDWCSKFDAYKKAPCGRPVTHISTYDGATDHICDRHARLIGKQGRIKSSIESLELLRQREAAVLAPGMPAWLEMNQ